MTDRSIFSPIDEILAEARNGRMFILVDDEDRENEGDLVIPAQMASPEKINFMAKYGRGLICLALTGDRVQELGLSLMRSRHNQRRRTAFTVSIEAREGITTGISAADRAQTIATAINPLCDAEDISTPGHVFPLKASKGGVLVRSGHTEAAVDIAGMSGLYPAGVICEIMNDDGTMARRNELAEFAQKHSLKMATIADLIAYRLRNEKLVERVETLPFSSEKTGDWVLHLYTDQLSDTEHVALVKGNIDKESPAPVRMHAVNLLDDLLHSANDGRAGLLDAALREIADEGNGVAVLLQDRSHSRLRDLLSGQASDGGRSTALREYGIGAQILCDLGIKEMRLMTGSSRTIVGLEGYGLKVADEIKLLQERLKNAG